jgi:hypothetical protein
MWNAPRAPFSARDQGTECIVKSESMATPLTSPCPGGE